MLVPGEGFVDVGTTRDLWTKDFLGPDAMIRKNGWPDKASIGIPALYVQTGMMLYDVLRSAHEDSTATRVLKQVEQVARATHIEEFFDFSAQPTLPPAVNADTAAKKLIPAVPKSPIPRE